MNYNEFIVTNCYPSNNRCGPVCEPPYDNTCNPICKPTCEKNKGYTVLKNMATIKYNNETTSTNETATIVYHPDLIIMCCYHCKCCKFMRGCCFCHCHYYCSKFTIYNPNEFSVYNTTINIDISPGLQYMKGTLKINNKYIDDTKPIFIDKIAPNEIVIISFISCCQIIDNQFNTFTQQLKINCCFLGFNNTPKYFNTQKYMIIK